MSVVESAQTVAEEESFIILGTTPTPSMDNLLIPPSSSSQPASVLEYQMVDSATPPTPTMERSALPYSFTSLSNGAASNVGSIAPQMNGSVGESSHDIKAELITSTGSIPALAPSKGPSSRQSIQNKENIPLSNGMGQSQPTASFILGETQSILHQFPSLAQSSMSFEEIQMLQKLTQEHSQLKESLQRANVAMRKNFASIQLLQDETKTRCSEQEARVQEAQRKLDEVTATNEKLTAEKDTLTTENGRLMAENGKLMAENGQLKDDRDKVRAAMEEKEAQMELAKKELQEELEEVRHASNIERKEAKAEIDELCKVSSERQAIVQNLAKRISDLELQSKGYVVVNNNKPEPGDGTANFVAADVHQQAIKDLERRMSVEVAKNLVFEDMRKLYVDEINCLKANLTAAEQMYVVSRTEAQKHFDDMKQRDDTIAQLRQDILGLQERVQVLTAQSDIYQKDFEAERTARQELASEKSRILGEFEVLQRRNAELTTQVSQTEIEREELAKRAAIMVQEATSSQEQKTKRKAKKDQPTATEPAEEERKDSLCILRCPLCLKAFKDFGSLQSHAADCMGID